MQQVTIKKIDVYTKDAQGNPLKGDYGFYTKVRITDEFGKQYYGYGNRITDKWEVGQCVKVNVTQSQGKNGKTYLNFKSLSETDLLKERIERLEEKVFGKEIEEQEVNEKVNNEDDSLPF